ncbi:MAG: thioredoxin domain-containing protein, partial [Eubacteriales bacterium]
MNENNSNSTEKLILKIVVPIMLVCVVVGIWAVKNVQKVKDASDNTTVAQINSSGNSDSNSNPDFAYSVTDELDMDKLKSYKLPIIIEFGAEWCAPCKQMAPIITALNKELRGKAIVRFVNTDENQ